MQVYLSQLVLIEEVYFFYIDEFYDTFADDSFVQERYYLDPWRLELTLFYKYERFGCLKILLMFF